MGARGVAVFLGNGTVDGNVDRICRHIMAGFAACGWEATVFDVSEGEPNAKFGEFLEAVDRQAIEVVLSVQEVGVLTGLDELFRTAKVRRLYWSLDHPYSGLASVRALPPGSVVTYPTRANLDCCRSYIRGDLTLACAAHGAEPRTRLDWSRRDIDLLFVGNVDGPDPDQIRANWGSEGMGPRLLNAMVETFQAAPDTAPEDLARQALIALGVMNADGNSFFALQRAFDLWARAHVRRATLAALAEVPLLLVGRGWEGLAPPRHRTAGARTAAEVDGLVGRARMVLNVLPGYYRSHERVFNGMAAGAAVVSTGSGYLANALGTEACAEDGTALAYLGALDQAGQRLAALVADPAAVEALAEAGWRECTDRHSWSHRVQALIAQLTPS